MQGNGTPDAFTCFLARAGVKKGFSYGGSDEFGSKAAVDPISVHDFNATLLHLLGLDHERLSFYHSGREQLYYKRVRFCEFVVGTWLWRPAAVRRSGVSPGPGMQEARRLRDGLERDAPATHFILHISQTLTRGGIS